MVKNIGPENLELDGITVLIEHGTHHGIAEMRSPGPCLRQLVEDHVMRTQEGGPVDSFLRSHEEVGGEEENGDEKRMKSDVHEGFCEKAGSPESGWA